MNSSNFHWFAPALASFLLGAFFLLFPLLALVLLVGVLWAFSLFYAVIVYRLLRHGDESIEVDVIHEPSFQNVSFYIRERIAGQKEPHE